MTVPDDRRRVAYESVGYYRARAPRGGDGPSPCLVAVHGYAHPSDLMLEYAASLVPDDVLVVAPEGPSAFYREGSLDPTRRGLGHGWSADPRRDDAERRNDALLDACLDDVARERPLDPGRTVLLGYSQGAGVAAHWWIGRPERAAGLVVLAGGLRKELRPSLERLRGRRVLLVSGDRDEHYPPAYEEALAADMRASGLEVETVVLRTGHRVLEAAREPVQAWIRSLAT